MDIQTDAFDYTFSWSQSCIPHPLRAVEVHNSFFLFVGFLSGHCTFRVFFVLEVKTVKF